MANDFQIETGEEIQPAGLTQEDINTLPQGVDIATEQRRAEGVGYSGLTEQQRADYMGSRVNALQRQAVQELEAYKKLQRQIDTSDVIDDNQIQEALRIQESLSNRGINPSFELRREKIERTNAIFGALTQNINPEKGLYGNITTQEVSDNKLGKILNSDQIFAWNNSDNPTREKMLFQAIKEVKLPGVDITDEAAAVLLMREYNADSINGVISKYSQNLQRQKEVEEGYYKAESNFLPALLENNGDVGAAIDSLGENAVYARSIFNNAPYLRKQYEAAYEATSWIKDEYIKNGSLDWDKMAERLLSLGEGNGSFRLAVEMLPNFLPDDNRTWVIQALDDTYEDVGAFVKLATSQGADEDNAMRLALAIQQEYRNTRDLPENRWGLGFKNLVDNVPKFAAVSLTSFLAGAATRNPVATYTAGSAMGAIVYGSSEGLEAYRTNSSRDGALAYGLTVGSLEGALDTLTQGAGRLIGRGVQLTATGRAAATGLAGLAERSTAAGIGRGAIAGAATETIQESISDPVYVGVENLYRNIGFDLTQQSTVRQWWENYNPFDPAFFIPTVILGGSAGALGAHQGNHIINKVSRSPSALVGLGIPQDVASQIATMPDSKERTNLIQQSLFDASSFNQSQETATGSSASMLNFVAKNAEQFKNVEFMPTFKDNGDGTFDVTETNPESGTQSTMTLTDEVAGTYLAETVSSNPSFIQSLNLFAQRQLEPQLERSGIVLNNDELLASIQNTEGINQSVSRARALAYIQSNPELREQYNNNEITVEEVANNLDVVSAYRAGQIAVIEGRANPLDILEEVIHANAAYDLATGAVTRDYIQDAVRKYGEYVGRDFGDLSNDVTLQEALATIGKGLATNPELFGSLPGDVQSILEWQKDNIAEVGNIFREGERIRQAVEDGVLDADFIQWSQSLANISEQTKARDIASLINEGAEENILPSVQQKTSALKVGPGIQTIEKAMSDIVGSTSSESITRLKKIRKSFMNLAEQAVAGKFSAARQRNALLNSVLTLENAFGRYGKTFIPQNLAKRLLNPKNQLQFEASLQTALDRGVKAINQQIQEAEYARTQRELRKLIDKSLAQSSREEALEARRKAKEQAKTVRGLERLAKRAYSDRKGVSRTLDAESRYESMAIEEIMLMSPEQLEEHQATIEQNLQRIINETQDPNAPQIISLQKTQGLLDLFGSVLYRERGPNGRYSYVRNAEEQLKAFEALRQLQDEGRLRWREELNRREEKLNIFREEISQAVGSEKSLEDLRELLRETGEYNTVKSFFTGMLSTVQLSEILGTLPGFEANGRFLLNEVVRATIERDNARIKRQAMISSWLKGAARLGGVKDINSSSEVARHFYEMQNTPVSFKGRDFVKSQLIKIYQTLQESDGLEVLRNNYNLDFGNEALLNSRLSQLGEELAGERITQEKYDSESARAQEEFENRLSEDQEALIEALGDDGLYLARSIQTAYREMGQRIGSVEESFFGQASTMEDHYTPRTTAHEGQLGDGFYDAVGYTPGSPTYSGRPSFMRKRSTPASAEITMLVNPVVEFERYAQIAEGWMSSLALQEYYNKVWLNTKTAAQIKNVVGQENFQVATKGLYHFLNDGRIKAQQGWLGEIFTKVMSTLARTKIFFSIASICRSGAAFFNPLVGSDFSSLEIIKGLSTWITRPNPLTLEEMMNLEGMKAREPFNYKDRIVLRAAFNAPRTKEAQIGYWQEVGNSALINFDLWSVQMGNMWAAQMLQNRGLSKAEIIEELNLNILKSAQPENQSTRAIGTLGGSAFEAFQTLFMSDMINKTALIASQFKRGDIGASRKLANFLRMWTVVGFASALTGMAASFFTNYGDDDFTPENILWNMSLGPLVSTPVFAGLFQTLDYYAFGGGHFFSRPNSLLDVQKIIREGAKAYETAFRATEDLDAVTLNEWIEVGTGLGRALGDVVGVTANIGNAKTVGRVFELVSAMSNATAQVHASVKSSRVDMNPFYDTREQLLTRAKELRRQKKQAKDDYGERSVEYRRLSRELRRVNKKIKDNGWNQ